MKNKCLNCFKDYDENTEICPHCHYDNSSSAKENFYLKPGTILKNQYIIGVGINAGGFGILYKGWDIELQIVVAIKEYFPTSIARRGKNNEVIVNNGKNAAIEYEAGYKRFLREARLTSKFNQHPNIVNVFDFFEENNTSFIVMELLEGIDCKEFVTKNNAPMEVPLVIEITSKVLNALEALEKEKVIHRDISPDNIFICKDGRIKLIDFGSAVTEKSIENNDPYNGLIVKKGMSPIEQYAKHSKNMKVGTYSDLYALGATIFYLLTLKVPFESNDRELLQKEAMKKGDIKFEETAKDINPNVPEYLDRAIIRAMAIMPNLRFSSVHEMIETIDKEKIVEFPEEILKRRKKKRMIINIITCISVTFAIGIGSYIIKEKNKDSIANLEISPTTISVAFPCESDLEKEKYKNLSNEFMEEYPDVKIDLILETKAKYIEIINSDNAPHMFLNNDDLDVPEKKLIDLTLLAESLNTDEYEFLEKYDITYPHKYQVPLAFEVLLCYENSSLIEKTDNNFTSLDNLENAGYSLNMNYSIENYLLNNDSINLLKSKGRNGFEVFANETVPYYVGSSLELRNVQKTLAGYYSVKLFTDKCIVYLQDNISICKTNENDQNACLLFAHYMLSDAAQNILYVQNDSYLPINKSTLNFYIKQNDDLKCILNYLSTAICYGEDKKYQVEKSRIITEWMNQLNESFEELEKLLK